MPEPSPAPAFPPLSAADRIRTAWATIRTGRHGEAEGFAAGMRIGFDGGFRIAASQFNMALETFGISPVLPRDGSAADTSAARSLL